MNANQKVKERKVETTDHPHIVKIEGVRGGRPLIRGTGITVELIASFFKAGESVEEILLYYPQLKSAQIYDAVSYYLDHQTEIEEHLEKNKIENVLKEFDLEMDERGVINPKQGLRSIAQEMAV